MKVDPQTAQQQLFGDALACLTAMPAALRTRAAEAGSVERAVDHAETVLRALALIEEPSHDESDDKHHDIAMQRVEAKLNLVLETLAGILRHQRSDLPMQTVRWSRQGAELVHPEAQAPEQGYLVLQPLSWVPQRLELPVRLLASTAESAASCRVWLRFEPQPAALEAALEKHLFRLHRRQLAQRKPG